MSLIRLLSVSTTFDSEKSKLGVYKLPKGSGMPRFSGNIPRTSRIGFKSEPVMAVSAPGQTMLFEAATVLPQVGTPNVEAQPAVETPKQAATADLAEETDKLTHERTISNNQTEGHAAPAGHPAKVASKRPAGKLLVGAPAKPWFIRFWEVLFGPANRRHGGAGVQTELALEQVVVIRNDLQDADLEVKVAPKRGGLEQPSAPVMESPAGLAEQSAPAKRELELACRD